MDLNRYLRCVQHLYIDAVSKHLGRRMKSISQCNNLKKATREALYEGPLEDGLRNEDQESDSDSTSSPVNFDEMTLRLSKVTDALPTECIEGLVDQFIGDAEPIESHFLVS